jgi:hypothetical protein
MGNVLEPSEHSERTLELAGWPVRLATYKLGDTYHCTVDNVSPGARIARTEGATKEEAEQKAIEVAERRLSRTRKMSD